MLKVSAVSSGSRSLVQTVRELCDGLAKDWPYIKSEYRYTVNARYKDSSLRLIWAFFMPVSPLIFYWVLSLTRIFPVDQGISHGAFVAAGVLLWLYLKDLTKAPVDVILNVVQKGHAENSILSSVSIKVLVAFRELLYRSLFLALVIFLSGDSVGINSLDSILFLVFSIPAFLSLGFALSLLILLYRDLQHIVNLFFQFGIFLSGALFPVSVFDKTGWIERCSPYTYFIDGFRESLFVQPAGLSFEFVAICAISCLAFLVLVRSVIVLNPYFQNER